jgi:hypothetical protein
VYPFEASPPIPLSLTGEGGRRRRRLPEGCGGLEDLGDEDLTVREGVAKSGSVCPSRPHPLSPSP